MQAPGQGRVGEGDRPASRFVVLWRLKIGEWARRARQKQVEQRCVEEPCACARLLEFRCCAALRCAA